MGYYGYHRWMGVLNIQEWSIENNHRRLLTLSPTWISARKKRLFAVACFRLLLDRLTPEDRTVLDVVERCVDGLLPRGEMFHRLYEGSSGIAETCVRRKSSDAALRSAAKVLLISEISSGTLANLVREIVNPWLPSIPTSIMKWNNGAVRNLAESIYEDHAFDHMSILGDALEEAGCTNSAIMSHVRCDHPHVRGCWLVDLILGRK